VYLKLWRQIRQHTVTITLGHILLLKFIGGVIVSVLTSSVVDSGFKPWSGQTKDYKIGICCFSAKHVALRRKSKDWLARNQDTVYVYPRTVVSVSQHYKNPKSSTMPTSSSSHWKLTCFRHDIAEKLLSWRLTMITHSKIQRFHKYMIPEILNNNLTNNVFP
jgi:hypothetical protein